MYKRYVELKTWWRIWVKEIDGDKYQIEIKDKMGEVVLKNDSLKKNDIVYMIDNLVKQNDIENTIESNR